VVFVEIEACEDVLRDFAAGSLANLDGGSR
jgi:hypothetical protein